MNECLKLDYVLVPNDHVLYIPSGLVSEYDPLVMTVNAKVGKADAYTIEEVNSLLISPDKRMKKDIFEKNSVNMAIEAAKIII